VALFGRFGRGRGGNPAPAAPGGSVDPEPDGRL